MLLTLILIAFCTETKYNSRLSAQSNRALRHLNLIIQFEIVNIGRTLIELLLSGLTLQPGHIYWESLTHSVCLWPAATSSRVLIFIDIHIIWIINQFGKQTGASLSIRIYSLHFLIVRRHLNFQLSSLSLALALKLMSAATVAFVMLCHHYGAQTLMSRPRHRAAGSGTKEFCVSDSRPRAE